MRPAAPKGFIFLVLVFFCGAAFAQSSSDVQKLQSQADDLEDKGAQAIDDGDMDRGLDYMVRAIKLDPSPTRHFNYGSILFGNGVSVFKDTDQAQGIVVLRQAEAQLRKAIAGFNPNKDQSYLGQCYFMLGEMYLNAFKDKLKAIAYYKKAVEFNDCPGACEALDKVYSELKQSLN